MCVCVCVCAFTVLFSLRWDRVSQHSQCHNTAKGLLPHPVLVPPHRSLGAAHVCAPRNRGHYEPASTWTTPTRPTQRTGRTRPATCRTLTDGTGVKCTARRFAFVGCFLIARNECNFDAGGGEQKIRLSFRRRSGFHRCGNEDRVPLDKPKNMWGLIPLANMSPRMGVTQTAPGPRSARGRMQGGRGADCRASRWETPGSTWTGCT